MSSSASSPPSKKLTKNAPGARLDPTWKYGIEVDAKSRKVKCKYCNVVQSGGIYRLKHHLACTHINVRPCPQVSDEVRKEMFDLLSGHAGESKKKIRKNVEDSYDSLDEEVEQRHKNFMDGCVNTERRQSTFNEKMKKHDRNEVCQLLARWFYASAIPFNAVNNPLFHKMIAKIGEFGRALKPPSYHEMRETFLKREVHDTQNLIKKHKDQWKKTGCTIMSDGWTDQRKLTMNNFFVNSPAGTVFLCSVDTTDISKTAEKLFLLLDDIVEKVGEENVVQIVTDNAANYKAAGQMLMEKRKHLFWTPCAAHCLDLMLEDFDKHHPVHKDTIAKGKLVVSFIYSSSTMVNWMKEFTKGKELVRPGITRFATSYLTLRRLHECKGDLFCFFSSDKWRNSLYAKKKKGQEVCTIIFDSQNFWSNVELCINIASPLIKVLRMVNSDDIPAMGFLYKAIERAKEEIKQGLKNVKSRYEPVFSIIDKRWQGMHTHYLHAVGYYLNPQYHYAPDFHSDVVIKHGLYACLSRMISDKDEMEKIDLQFDIFKHARGLFGIEMAIQMRNKKSPADWWDSFGDECPELQKFAIRVLSLTCSSSGRELNGSAFELVHSKRRNQLAQKRMNDSVFVMYNLKLREREKKRQQKRMFEFDELSFENILSDDEWITEKESVILPKKNVWLKFLDDNANGDKSDEEDIDDVEFIATHIQRTFGEGPSGSHGKRKKVSNQLKDEVKDEDEDKDEDDTNVEDEDNAG